jgi:hypothetical protein
MSLILDALRKLDRDRANPERGFAVLGAQAWRAEGGRRRSLAALGLGIAGVAVVTGAAAWLWVRPGGRSGVLRDLEAETRVPTDRAASPSSPRLESPPSPAPSAAARSEVAPPTPAGLPRPAAEATPRARDEPRSEVSPRRFVLTAIGARDGVLVAVLDDRLVRVGDEFDGVRIVRIGAAEVELEVGGVRRIVGF